jgi:S1-C subfamily serine protease
MKRKIKLALKVLMILLPLVPAGFVKAAVAKATTAVDVVKVPASVGTRLKNHFADELQLVDIEPAYDLDNEVTGMTITDISKGSVVPQVGLKKGDKVISVNGVKITSILDAMSVYNETKDSDHCHILIMRDKKLRLLKLEEK